MKMRMIKAFAMIGIAIATLCSCGSKSVKGADGKEYDSYQAACINEDFNAAYEWIEKNNGSEEDKDYVFNAEMLFLASQNTEEASNRILYLLSEFQIPGTPVVPGREYEGKEYKEAKNYLAGIERFNNRCNNVLDLAIAQGNEKLACAVVALFKENFLFWEQPWRENIDIFDSGDASDYYSRTHHDINKAKEKLEVAYKIFIKNAINSGDIDQVKRMVPIGLKVGDSDLISQLASLKNKEISDEILNLISEFKIKGSRVPSNIYDDVFDHYSSSYNKNYIDYISSINEYNKVCDQIFEIAISKGNDYLAKNVLLKYKEDVYKLQGGSGVKTPDGKPFKNNGLYYVYYKYDSKNNAQKRYNEAVKSGAFNK